MNIGDKVDCIVKFGEEVTTSHGHLQGTVIYIHPKKIFYTVEIRVAGGTFRESYYLPQTNTMTNADLRHASHWRHRKATYAAAKAEMREQEGTLDGAQPHAYMTKNERESFRRTLIRIAGLDEF